MSALSGEDLRKCWIANAERLARLGHFAKYSPKQRSEVLRKGYLGPWAPDQGIKIARKEAELGYAVWTRNYIDSLLSKTGRNLATRVAIKGFACPELEF